VARDLVEMVMAKHFEAKQNAADPAPGHNERGVFRAARDEGKSVEEKIANSGKQTIGRAENCV